MNGFCELYIDWSDENGESVTEEKFIAGKVYQLSMSVNLITGGAVSDDVVLVIDGKEYAPDDIYPEQGQAFLTITCEAQEGKTAPERKGHKVAVKLNGKKVAVKA